MSAQFTPQLTTAEELDRLRSLIAAQKEYIELLGKELDEVIFIAWTHGWRSKNYELGVAAREKIAKYST